MHLCVITQLRRAIFGVLQANVYQNVHALLVDQELF
jgi:hypothetical protein